MNPPTETLYFRSTHDANGDLLDSDKEYRITFDSGQLPKCNAFWSLTTYDSNLDLIANPLNKYAIRGGDEDLIFEPDGSLILHIQRRAYEEVSANWAPAPDDGPFAMTMRCYEPDAIMADIDYLRETLPSIIPVE